MINALVYIRVVVNANVHVCMVSVFVKSDVLISRAINALAASLMRLPSPLLVLSLTSCE